MDKNNASKKRSFSEGDIVEIAQGNKRFVGTVVPSSSKKMITLKFASGYNAGFLVDEINVKRIGEGRKVCKGVSEKTSFDKSLPKLSVLHTGGTIAARVDYSVGGVVAAFSPDDLLSLVPELKDIVHVECKMVSNILSEDMGFSGWKKISRAIREELKKGVRGIIVGHGTDTLGYTAAAISFMLRNIPVPIVFVGSQRSTDRPSTDAGENILNAAYFIANTDFCGVAVCMHETMSDGPAIILSGTKVRKLHTSRRDAFRPVNDLPIARVDYAEKKIEYLKKDYPRKPNGALIVAEKIEEKVGLLKVHPGISSTCFDFFTKNKYRGLVLEGTGMGQTPMNTKENELNFFALKKFIDRGGVVAITSQCVFGRVHSKCYPGARRLENMGCVYCEDMLAETAYAKLVWLLGNYPKKAKELMSQNLVGELSESSSVHEPCFPQ
jgi:glutamyl-tRNA(Gln) amidotransferase subunit D